MAGPVIVHLVPDGTTIVFEPFDDGEPGGFWVASCRDCPWNDDTLDEFGGEKLTADATAHRRDHHAPSTPPDQQERNGRDPGAQS